MILMAKRKPRPGSSWRLKTDMPNGDPCIDIQSEGHSILDEVVISPWLHVEQMDEDQWWVRIGDREFFVCARGKEVRVEPS